MRSGCASGSGNIGTIAAVPYSVWERELIEITDHEEFKAKLLSSPLEVMFMLPRHAAASLGVGMETIQKMVADGRLVEVKYGEAMGIRYKEVLELEKLLQRKTQ